MRFAKQLSIAAALLGACAAAIAHEGHGLPGTIHWHATDAWGFAVVAALAALAIWSSRDK
jgi:hypothetical protein